MGASSRQSAPHRSSTAAFTLIEFIAVLGIVTMLASVVSLNVVERLKRTARQAEAVTLETMVGALRTNILRTRRIPASTNWAAAIAEELGISASRVLQTTVGNPRLFRHDPALQIGAASVNPKTLPFTQGLNGSVQPVESRLLFVSSVGLPLPVAQAQASTFQELWATSENAIPATWTTWNSPGDDLKMQRMDLRDLFHRVVLSNVDPDHAAPYSVDASTNLMSLPSSQGREAWFFATTMINLHYADQSLQAREFLRRDVSYVFENGRWSRYVNYGLRPPLTGFGMLAEQFRQCPVPPGNKFGASPQAVIEELFTYLYTYGIWATGDPPAIAPFDLGGSTSAQQVPSYQVLLDGQKRLEQIAGNLID